MADATVTEKLLTKEEACVFLGISAPTLDRWLRAGKVSAIKYGKAVRFSKESLTANSVLYQTNQSAR